MDYRHSHLAKGDTYDATIATQPFDAYMAKYEEEYLREVIPRLTRGGGRYLDFACGTGRITSIVAPLVTESVGVDISESMLERGAREVSRHSLHLRRHSSSSPWISGSSI